MSPFQVVSKPPYWLVNPPQTAHEAPRGPSAAETPAWVSSEGPPVGDCSAPLERRISGGPPGAKEGAPPNLPVPSECLLNSGRPEPLHLFLAARLAEGASPLLPWAPHLLQKETAAAASHGVSGASSTTCFPCVSRGPSEDGRGPQGAPSAYGDFARVLRDSSLASGCAHRLDCETSGEETSPGAHRGPHPTPLSPLLRGVSGAPRNCVKSGGVGGSQGPSSWRRLHGVFILRG